MVYCLVCCQAASGSCTSSRGDVAVMCFINRALIFDVSKVVGGLPSGHRWSKKASCQADGTQQVDVCWGVVS